MISSTMAKLLMLLVLIFIADSSCYKPCHKVLLHLVRCQGNLSSYLKSEFLTNQTVNYGMLEITHTDISNLEAKWTEGKNAIWYFKVSDNKKLNNLSSDSFKNLKDLTILNLRNNNISTLNDIVFLPLKKLEYLNLERNNLHRIQTGLFSNQGKLKFLYLNHNKIKDINSVVLNSLSNLEELYLQGNILEKLDGRCFMSLEKLSVLDLNNNHLRELPTTLFQYQKHLEELKLNENEFTEFDLGVIAQLHHLHNFTFRNNNIQTLNFDKFESLAELRVLDLSDCRIPCDCRTKIFIQNCFERSIELKITCKRAKVDDYVDASEYLSNMDCSIVENPKLPLLIILGLLFLSLLVDIFVSWLNYRYDLSTHRGHSSELVNEYEYVDNFKDLEEKAYKSAGMRDSGRYHSVLQKMISVYDYLRPLPGRRLQEETSNGGTSPPVPLYSAPRRPESNLYDVAN